MPYRIPGRENDEPPQELQEDERLCPACASPLATTPRAPDAFFCSRCGGVWTATAAAARIVEELESALVAVAEEASAKAKSVPPPAELAERRCPECNGPLHRACIAATVLDVCDEHGTWFDRDELQRVTKVLHMDRPEPRKPGPPLPPRRDLAGELNDLIIAFIVSLGKGPYDGY